MRWLLDFKVVCVFGTIQVLHADMYSAFVVSVLSMTSLASWCVESQGKKNCSGFDFRLPEDIFPETQCAFAGSIDNGICKSLDHDA